MIIRKWPIVVLLGAAAAASVAVACSETGPDAGPRTNGCIGEGCFDASAGGDGSGPGPGQDGGGNPDGGVEITDPLVGITLTATLVVGGFVFTEGPVWIGGRLLFGDIQSNPTKIVELAANNTTTVFRTPGNGPGGNAVDPQGRLVTTEGRNTRAVVRSDATAAAARTTLASQFGGLPFNSPNDLIVRADGNIYFTDPDYGADPDAGARQPKQGVFRIAPAGAVSRVKEYDTLPNGIGLSPDGTKLYVVDNDPAANVVNVWSLAGDGTPSGETKFATVVGGDGMAVDDRGNVYVAATAGIIVFDNSGATLGTITVPEVPSNCTFGGADRKTLYITARTGLYSIRLNVAGLP